MNQIVKEIATGINKINKVERIAVFCCTLIIITSIIWSRYYSLPIIMYCLSGIAYFLLLGYFRVEENHTTKETDGTVNHTVKSEYQFARRDLGMLYVLKVASFLFFILASISLWLTYQA